MSSNGDISPRSGGALRENATLAGPWAAACALLVAGCAAQAKFLFGGDSRELRARAETAAQSSPTHAPLLVLCFDGVDRALLYELLRAGELPQLARLLGGQSGRAFPSAYFSDRLLSTLPSSTIAAWVTAFTGVGPAQHGVTGNEFFIREERRFAAPAPASFNDDEAVLSNYTEQYLNQLTLAPSVYERIREKDPGVLEWVAMQHFYRGADRLLLTKRTIVAGAFAAFVEGAFTGETARLSYEKLDKAAMDVVVGALDADVLPDVLTVYLSGTDLYAHVADEGPDRARRTYLREVIDPELGRLVEKLASRGALDDLYVVVTSDHGHTEVVHDEAHLLAAEGERSVGALLERAGFRVRPAKLAVAGGDDFNAVLAYQGAMAYVYLADRSGCEPVDAVCDWASPPRFEEDVLVAAEALRENDARGHLVPGLKGTLDLVLTRRPRPFAEDDAPFEVYVGGGETVPIGAFMASHPHPTYVDFERRLADLSVGPHGERAGDILLVAHSGDRDDAADRYYFAASPYRSWHGSPSRKDSEIPLILAHANGSTEALGALVESALGDRPHQQKVTELLMSIRGLPR